MEKDQDDDWLTELHLENGCWGGVCVCAAMLKNNRFWAAHNGWRAL